MSGAAPTGAYPFLEPPPPPERTLRQRTRLLALRVIGRLYPRAENTSESRSILLIRPDHLGDLLLLTPALEAIRRALPRARLTVLVGPWGRVAIERSVDVDAVDTCPFPGFERPPRSGPLVPYRLLMQQARALRAARYDTAVILRYDHWWGAWLASAAGISRRIGYQWPETRPFLTQTIPYLPHLHETQQNAALLAVLSPASEWQLGPLSFRVSDEDRSWANGWLAQRGADPSAHLVAIHAGAGAVVKQWPAAGWARVANGISGAFSVQIVLTGAASEQELVSSLATAIESQAISAAGQTTLGHLAAIQERCTLVLGSDSGPLHLAVAVGTPTIHLYGPVASDKFGPWGDRQQHIVITAPWPCVPCNRLDWPAEAIDRHACLASITPEMVLEAACRILAERGVQAR